MIYWVKIPLLKLGGEFLIHEDPIEHAEAIFVLGGNAFDRGNKASELYASGLQLPIYCTSGVMSFGLASLGFEYYESEVTKIHLMRSGVPDSLIFAITEATSTFEESEIILKISKEKGYTDIIIVSSLFHTKRIHYVFKNKFEKEGIHIYLQGAHDSQYDEKFWWQTEQGLIMVNNEFVKLFYYWLKGQI